MATNISQLAQNPSELDGLHTLPVSATAESATLRQRLDGRADVEARLREARRAAAGATTLVEALHASALVGVAYLDCDLRFLRVNQALAG